MRTLQCALVTACTVADVPGAIPATRQPNAHIKASELIIVFVNFVFIVMISSLCLRFVCLAVFDFPYEESFLAVQ